MIFRKSSELCNHYHNPLLEYVHHSLQTSAKKKKKNPYACWHLIPIPTLSHSQLKCIFFSTDLSFLDTSYRN